MSHPTAHEFVASLRPTQWDIRSVTSLWMDDAESRNSLLWHSKVVTVLGFVAVALLIDSADTTWLNWDR